MSRNTLWSVFGTDARKEIDGVLIEYPGGIRVKLARAGGRNEQFAKSHEIHMRPHRQAAKIPGGLSERVQREVIIKVFLDAVIRSFEMNVGTEENPEWKPVIVQENGDEVMATREALTDLFHQLPDLLMQIVQDANDLSLYRKAQLEEETKNS